MVRAVHCSRSSTGPGGKVQCDLVGVQLRLGTAVPRQPFLPVASMGFAALTPSLTIDPALHTCDNL